MLRFALSYLYSHKGRHRILRILWEFLRVWGPRCIGPMVHKTHGCMGPWIYDVYVYKEKSSVTSFGKTS